jgi:hypothetical protein
MRRTPRLSRTRLATCTSGDVFACNMNDVREGSASTTPGCARGPLLTGDWCQGTAVIHRSPRRVCVTLMTNSVVQHPLDGLNATVRTIP